MGTSNLNVPYEKNLKNDCKLMTLRREEHERTLAHMTYIHTRNTD